MNKRLTFREKIDKLNEICDNSLSITRYNEVWTCNSYHLGSALNDIEFLGHIEGETFEEMLDNAFDYIEEHKNVLVVDGKKYRYVEEED